MLQSYGQTTSSATRTAMGPATESSPRRIWRCRYHAQAFTTSASTASPGSSLRKRKPSYCPRKPRPNAAHSEPSAGKQPAPDMDAKRDPKLPDLSRIRVALIILLNVSGEIGSEHFRTPVTSEHHV